MQRAAAILLLSFVGLIYGLGPRQAVAADDKKPCIYYWGEARYVIGYDHIVHVVNKCEAEANCTLTTSVNPQPEVFNVAPGEHRVITTWRGSPSATFAINLDCKLPEGT
jgi:hypothetical protein